MRTPVRLPDAVRNPASLLGMVIATTMAVLFVVLVLLEVAGYLENPYIGLLIFVTVPVLFVLGLLLIPAGAWWNTRRRRLHPERAEWPVIDLSNPHHRTVVVAVLGLTFINVVIVSLAAYGGVHYMESREFCGQVCHTPMEPQYQAYGSWPHARVECVQCHVGSGSRAFVESKLAGTRQLYHVVTDTVSKPIPPPVDRLRPARDTCERCHWPEKFHGDELRIIREYSNDETSSESVTMLKLHVGGGSSRLGAGTGIHWHMNLTNTIEYVATDAARETIPYVRMTDPEGHTSEFFAEGVTPQQIAGAPRHRMECTDCHNRPAHTFFFTPGRAVDTAIAEGRIPRALPFVRREAVAAVAAEYPDRAAALDAISRRLNEFYAARNAVEPRQVRQAVAAAQDVWARNVFPAMKVKWGTYANHIGHVDSPGCFRCHDDSHKATDGRVIRQDCELCHTLQE